jgi:hypothetical protein
MGNQGLVSLDHMVGDGDTGILDWNFRVQSTDS